MQAIQSDLLVNRDGWIQNTVRSLGSYAQTPNASYALATLFALSTPFGFATPAQAAAEAAAKLYRQQKLESLASSSAGAPRNSVIARFIANAQTQKSAQVQASVRALPPFWQLAFFAAAFGTGGYIIDRGDSLNGSGVVSAWSLTYLLFKTLPSLKQLARNPLAASLSVGVLTLGLGVHGSHYFDRTSWKGAIPSLASQHAQSTSRSKLISFNRVGKTSSESVPTSIFAKRDDEPQAVAARDVEAIQVEAAQNLKSCRNNDSARTAAFLHRQGGADSGTINP
ncbi:uncharacterized protein MEPE_05934 [Melanopsichium pennsylvanicum]|uniref:Uncharacterized protein n=2 Tax=Melanopsichium pennsylvanicum TaxID=63383 RepID=A0AAJ5C879_9BASI|nr:hypothetical protein BN887_03764 [Melanopsichium pennsylvanicum 4]SNX87224.1 uncharacterized protein MEPE_05934 [Melanopsichium pennsylvanicum]